MKNRYLSLQQAIWVVRNTVAEGELEATLELRLLNESINDDVVEVVRCKDCIHYDQPHIENHGERHEYKDMPKDAFDKLGTGLVHAGYGINIEGRCTKNYNAGYAYDKRVYVSANSFCSYGERAEA